MLPARDGGETGAMMPTAVQVEAAVPGRRQAAVRDHDVTIGVEPGSIALRDLLDAVVRAEIEAFRARAEEQTFVRVLTQAAIDDGSAQGTIRSGDRVVPSEVDPDEAVAAALLAQTDGLFQVIVDDEPVDDLDDVVDLRPDTRLLFLRLVPLAGG